MSRDKNSPDPTPHKFSPAYRELVTGQSSKHRDTDSTQPTADAVIVNAWQKNGDFFQAVGLLNPATGERWTWDGVDAYYKKIQPTIVERTEHIEEDGNG